MTESDTDLEPLAVPTEENGLGVNITPEANQNDSVVLDLWSSEDSWSETPKTDSHPSDNLKMELETLTIERERLKNENIRLAEMLESIKLEEEIAVLKQEVNALGGENEQLLIEIQRRKQSIVKN